MRTTVSTLHYYPKHIREMKEYVRLTAGIDSELYRTWDEIERIQRDQWLDTMDEQTVAQFEKFLEITPASTDDLDARKLRIKGYFISDLPFTIKKMREMLDALCGVEKGYLLNVSQHEGRVDVRVNLRVKNLLADIEKLVRKMAPADMIVAVDILYNLYATYLTYNYRSMGHYTWQQLREDETFQRDFVTHSDLGHSTHGDLSEHTHLDIMTGE